MAMVAIGSTVDAMLPIFVGFIVGMLTTTPPGEMFARHGQELAVMAVLVLVRPLTFVLDTLVRNHAITPNIVAIVRWQSHWHVIRQSWNYFQNDFAGRLSTIAAMDRLVVLDRGRIVEEATHAELLAARGHYARLWERQSGGFLDLERAAEQGATWPLVASAEGVRGFVHPDDLPRGDPSPPCRAPSHQRSEGSACSPRPSLA